LIREGERAQTVAKEIVLGAKISRMPRHPANEIKTGTLQSILKDLDLNM